MGTDVILVVERLVWFVILLAHQRPLNMQLPFW